MDRLDKILNAALAKKGLSKTLRAAQICFWAEEWGKGQFRAVSFSQGILKVSVRSSVEASEFEMQKETLLDYLNAKIGREMIRSIRTIIQW